MNPGEFTQVMELQRRLADVERERNEFRDDRNRALSEAATREKEIAQIINQRDAALAKLAEAEAGAAAMRLEAETVYQEMEATCNEDDGRERGSFWVPYYRGFQTKLAAIIDASTAGTALLEDLKTLRTALEQYADPGNWTVGSKYDGEGRSFTGPDEARKALDEVEQVPNPETPPSKND